jgi:hypothetical protein
LYEKSYTPLKYGYKMSFLDAFTLADLDAIAPSPSAQPVNSIRLMLTSSESGFLCAIGTT